MTFRRIEYTIDYEGLTIDEAVAIEDRITEAVAETLLNGCTEGHDEPHDGCPAFGWVGTATPVCEHCGEDIKCFETHVPNGEDECLRMRHVHAPDRCEGQHCVIHHPADTDTPNEWNSAERFCHRCKARNIDSWFVASERWREAGFQDNEIVCPQCFTQAWEKATGKLVTWELSIDPLTLHEQPTPDITTYPEAGA